MKYSWLNALIATAADRSLPADGEFGMAVPNVRPQTAPKRLGEPATMALTCIMRTVSWATERSRSWQLPAVRAEYRRARKASVRLRLDRSTGSESGKVHAWCSARTRR